MRFFLLFSGILISATASLHADWNQFRGDNAQGVSEESVAREWSAEDGVVWKTELPGRGSSSPIVIGDAVFCTSYTGQANEVERHLFRIALATGEVVWQQTVPVGFPEDEARGYILEHGWASNTPVSDGENLYCFFGKAGVVAFDLDGKKLWAVETGGQSSQKRWGSASSPILYEDLLIIPAGDERRAILALDKSSGEIVWEQKRPSLEQTYGTPVVVEVDENRTDLVFAGAAEWMGLDPSNGEVRWTARYNLPGNNSNTTAVSDEVLTISGGFPRTARVAMPIGVTGDATDQLLYDTQKPATYMTAPVEHDGVLYWISDSGIAFAAEPGEAEPLWAERLPGLQGGGRGKPFYASPILAGGLIYAQSRGNGTFVLEPSRDGLKLVAQNRIEGDTTEFNGTPAVAGGKLLLRSQTHLYAIGE